MAFGDRTLRRWHDVWQRRVSADEVGLLREVIRDVIAMGRSATAIAEEADVHPHDVRNFLAKPVRPGHWPGLRMLRFAANLANDGTFLPVELAAKVDRLREIASRLSIFEPDDDLFFRHLQRLDVTSERGCQQLCAQLAGHYYSHRLSRNPNRIIRSHYEFQPFNPYNRLPHVINRLKYGSLSDPDAVERTAEGQIFQMADTLVLIGFVYRGYRGQGRKTRAETKYDGIQINIFPSGQFSGGHKSVIDGVFTSYVYDDRYEMGEMKLVRTKDGRAAKFDPLEVGEFSFEEIQSKEPGIDFSGLKLDLSANLEGTKRLSETEDRLLLVSCLSFMVTGDRVSHSGA